MANRIAVLTDSTASIPEDLREKLDIHVIPLLVNWEDHSYLDNVDISTDEFYTRLQISGTLPSTSQPSAGAFKDFFVHLSETYAGIVAVLLSSELSGTVASALAAKEMMPAFPIEIIDSRLTTMALGMLVVKAAEAAQADGDLESVAAAARNLIGKVRVMFVLDTLEFLHKGGRIGGAKRLLGSMLSLKPLLQLEDGKISAVDSVRTKKKALQSMVSRFQNQAEGESEIHFTVFHGLAQVEAASILEGVEADFQLAEGYLTTLSPVIGVHTGPGTVGIAYYFE